MFDIALDVVFEPGFVHFVCLLEDLCPGGATCCRVRCIIGAVNDGNAMHAWFQLVSEIPSPGRAFASVRAPQYPV